MVSDDKLLYRLAFSSVRGMNVTLGRELIRLCGSEKAFFEMPETQLRYLTGSTLSNEIFSAAYRERLLSEARPEALFVSTNGVNTVYFTEPDYPSRLLECEDAPVLLYGCGNCNLNASRVVGIVGTRHATPYGLEFTRRLVEELAEGIDDLLIVSGLAYGIDVAAHRAALSSGVPTAAVMATSINTIYPADHRATAVEMVRRGGMLLTEYASNATVHRANFLARNRIVAGLCDCLVVSESAFKGGALVTARLASEYNRDVFALPGRTSDRYSAGCNSLISADVAHLITGADDLCGFMGWPLGKRDAAEAQPELPLALNPVEEQIVKYLEQNEDASLNQLTAATGMPVAKLMSTLIDMEFRNLVIALPGARYRKM